MSRFEDALRKAVLGPHERALEAPKAPNPTQLIQGPLGVAGRPHGSPQGMWGRLFGPLTPQNQVQSLEDQVIESMTG